MRKEIKKVKELTSKQFGINVLLSEKKLDTQLQLILKVLYEKKVPVAVVVHFSPDAVEDVIKELKAHGVTVVILYILVLLLI